MQQRRYWKYIILALMLSGAMFLGILALFVVDDVSPGPDQYTPSFTTHAAELVLGDSFPQAHLYVRTDAPHTVGKPSDTFHFLSVYKPSDSSRYQRRPIAVPVAAIGAGYIVFTFPIQNFDCFGVYAKAVHVPFTTIEYARLPRPSDAWMCKGFNFTDAYIER